MEELIGILVVFNERGYWSKAYTYLHPTIIDDGTPVVVPTQHFFNVGKVVGHTTDFPKKNSQGAPIKYRRIISALRKA